jgi:hypothetical protein
MDKLTKEARMALAIEDLDKQAKPNIKGIAKTYQVD